MISATGSPVSRCAGRRVQIVGVQPAVLAAVEWGRVVIAARSGEPVSVLLCFFVIWSLSALPRVGRSCFPIVDVPTDLIRNPPLIALVVELAIGQVLVVESPTLTRDFPPRAHCVSASTHLLRQVRIPPIGPSVEQARPDL